MDIFNNLTENNTEQENVPVEQQRTGVFKPETFVPQQNSNSSADNFAAGQGGTVFNNFSSAMPPQQEAEAVQSPIETGTQPTEGTFPAGDFSVQQAENIGQLPVAFNEGRQAQQAEEIAALSHEEENEIAATMAFDVPEEATAQVGSLGDFEKTIVADVQKTSIISFDKQKNAANEDDFEDLETRINGAVDAEEEKSDGAEGKGRGKSVGKTVVKNIFRALFVAVCICVMVASVFVVNLSMYLVEETQNDDEILSLERLRLVSTQNTELFVFDPSNPNAEKEGAMIQYEELHGDERRIWVDLANVPDNLENAFLAIEDKDFREHGGISVQRTIWAALNQVFHFEDFQFGASTINQQLIKNITDDDDISIERKIREIYRAVAMDKKYSKDQIMEAYLNYVGLSENIRGVGAGADVYFGKEVKDLTLGECAIIAGITQEPTTYSPVQRPEESHKRRDHVLKEMLKAEFITQKEYDDAIAEPFVIREQETKSEEEVLSSANYSYYTDMVIADVLKDLMTKLNLSESEALRMLYSGGLRIEIAMDVRVQNIVDEYFLNGLDEDGWFTNRKNANGKTYLEQMLVQDVDRNTGEPLVDDDGEPIMVYPQVGMTILGYDGRVLAIGGGIGEKTTNRGINFAVFPRQTGSTMKPVAAYALAIDYGYVSYSTGIVDSGVPGRFQAKPALVDEEGNKIPNWPSNINTPPYGNQPVPVVSAISKSLNTVAAKVGDLVTAQVMYDFLVNTLHVTTLVEEDKDIGPLALGMLSEGMTTRELAGAYQMFGNGGVFNPTRSYLRVLDPEGQVVMEAGSMSEQAISPDSAYIMNKMLWTVLRSGAAPGVYATAGGKALPADVTDSIAKTGSTDNYLDRWFAGLTPYYVSTIWWGYENRNFDLEYWNSGTNYNIPVNLWYDLMLDLHEGLEKKEFPAPSDTIVTKQFCTSTGYLAGPGCPTWNGYYSTDPALDESSAMPQVCDGNHAAAEPAA